MGTSAAQISPPPGSGEGCGDPRLLGFFSYGAGELGDAPAAASHGGYMFRREMMNRAMHAAARGGDLEILRELLQGCSIAVAYQDAQGATILNVAASRGQVERDGQGPAGVQTPSTPSPSRQRPAPSLVQRPRHPRPPPRSSAAPSASAASHPK
ncbi:hypothetical protein CFC21_005461 [Triticum aestivum]|uniref:Uncharacterized protein n=2 Tax=Triticum aestivum TaxID=4565 RepID=A0A9R1D9P5_WHEAT|nr:uncharacterized protein LOC123087144 [Triticum aestivum]KAF6987856.1 hypothetical protein CFC21_005461 [Triticum aestivum]